MLEALETGGLVAADLLAEAAFLGAELETGALELVWGWPGEAEADDVGATA